MKFSQANGGHFSLRDFREHQANWVEPVSTSYRGYDVWEIPPNGQGIVTLQILNMLETFDIGSLKPNSAEHLHLFIEAKKLAYEDRAVYYADMDFAKVPLQELISKDYARERAKLIDPKRAAQQVAPGRVRSGAETTYLTAADGEGNMVSLIQSNFNNFGSRYAVRRSGVRAAEPRAVCSRSIRPICNRLEPHKRPFHTIIPAFMTREGRPVFSFGVRGRRLPAAGAIAGSDEPVGLRHVGAAGRRAAPRLARRQFHAHGQEDDRRAARSAWNCHIPDVRPPATCRDGAQDSAGRRASTAATRAFGGRTIRCVTSAAPIPAATAAPSGISGDASSLTLS